MKNVKFDGLDFVSLEAEKFLNENKYGNDALWVTPQEFFGKNWEEEVLHNGITVLNKEDVKGWID